jgi:MFS family permease
MAAFKERALVPVLVLVGLVVSVISSLGAPLIPTIARNLHTTLVNAQWSLTAPLVVAVVASPFVGRLGDGRHRRTVILTCLAVAVIGGALGAVASSLLVLVLGRAMQGLGLALMPLTMASAREHLAPERSPQVIAVLSVVAAVGVGLGYPLTGLIAQYLGVSGAFWFGALVCALALALSAVVIPTPRRDGAGRRLDASGAVLIGLALVALLLGLVKGPDWGWGTARTLVALAIGIVLLGVWARHELAVVDPLVELRLVRDRSVLTANVVGLAIGVCMYMSLVLLTQFVQLPGFGFDASVFVAGLTLLPMSILSALVSRSLPWVQARVGLRPVLPIGATAFALAMLFFALTSTQLWEAFVTMGVIGLGVGYTFAALPGLIVTAIPARETGSAMGFYQVSRLVGFALGSALCATFLTVFGHGVVPTLSAYRSTALVVTGLALLCAVTGWVLPGKSAHLRGHDGNPEPVGHRPALR